MSTAGRTIRLFLVDGSATGLMTAEIMNWSGHAFVVPRTLLPEALERDEADRTGVYFLIGPSENDLEAERVYIGETDSVGPRLKHHDKNEHVDWWERAIIFTSKDQNLTKAHVKYLEAVLIEEARALGNNPIANREQPQRPNLPESDLADTSYFLDQIKQILPVLGLNLLKKSPVEDVESQTAAESASEKLQENRYELKAKRARLTATAREIGGEFVVFKGSAARSEWAPGSQGTSYHRLYDKLVHEGKLARNKPTDKHLMFQTNISFSSPSAAAAVILGRAANGRTEWRVAGTDTTYAAHKQEELDALIGPALDEWLAKTKL